MMEVVPLTAEKGAEAMEITKSTDREGLRHPPAGCILNTKASTCDKSGLGELESVLLALDMVYIL
jgi:hypothetical protein